MSWYDDLANGKYKVKNANASNSTKQNKTSSNNWYYDLANGKYKVKEPQQKLLEEPQKQQVSYTPVNINKFRKDIFLSPEEIDKRIYTLPDGTMADKNDYTKEEQDLLMTGKFKINPNYDPSSYFSQKVISANPQIIDSKKFEQQRYDNANALGKAQIIAGKVGNTAKDIVGSAGVGVISAAEGLANTGIAAVGNVANLVGAKDTGNYLTNMAKDKVSEELKQELDMNTKSGYGRYTPNILGMDVRDIVQEGARMVTAGTAGLPGFVGSAIGNNVQEALNEGESLGRATAYGTVTGTIEGATEKLFDTFNLLGGGVLDKFVPKNVIAKFATGAIGEGIEEMISESLNPFAKILTYEGETTNPFASGKDFKEYVKSIGQSGWQGFVMGMFMQGVHDVSNAEVRKQYKEEVTKAVNKVKGLTQQQKQVAIDTLVNEANTSNIQPESMEKLINNKEAQQNVLPRATETQIQQPKQETTTDTELKLPTTKTNSVYQAAKGNVDVKIANRLMDIAERTSARVEGFYDENPDIEGSYKDGVIRINVNSEKAADTIFAHEFTHHLESTNAWEDVRDAIINSNTLYNMLSEQGINIDEYKQQIKDAYAKIKTKENPNGIILDDAGVEKEIVAKFVESKLMKDEKTIVRMINENPSFMQRLKNFWDDLVVRFKGTAEEKELRRIQNIYNKAFAEAQKGSTQTTETKYSVGEQANTDNQGRKLSQEQQEFFKDSKARDKDGNLLAMYHGTRSDKFNVFDINRAGRTGNVLGEGFYFFDSEAAAGLYSGSKGTIFETYLNVTNPLELNSIDDKRLKELKAEASQKQMSLRDYLMSLGYDGVQAGNIYAVFEPNQIKNVDNTKPTSDPDIRYSINTDNMGRKLSEQQQEFFKDSKARDEYGNLQVVYHGTADEINVFDKSRLGETTKAASAMEGFFFTSTKTLAEQYSQWSRPKRIVELEKEYKRLKEIAERVRTNEAWDKYYRAYEAYEDAELDYAYDTDNARTNSENQKEVYLNLKNPLIKDFEGQGYRDVSYYDLIIEAKENGKDGAIFLNTYDGWGDHDTSTNPLTNVYVAFESNQIKNVDNTNPTENPDIRYSINTDNMGRKLSEQQQEFFKDSKVRDENGKLLVMYHKSENEFTVFDKKKIGKTGSWYGKGFYFTPDISYFDSGDIKGNNIMKVYLDIKKPLKIEGFDKKITKKDIDNILKNISEDKINNIREYYYRKYNIEQKDNYNQIRDKIKEYLFNLETDQDILNELTPSLLNINEFGEIFKKETGYDGIINPWGDEYIVFEPNQIKNVDNLNPTSDADIRYSIETDKQTSTPKREKVVDKIAPQTDIEIDNLPNETEKVARILTKAPKKQQDFSFETVKDVLMRKIVDAGNTINTIGKIAKDDVLYPMYNNTKQARQSAEYMIGEKQTDITGTRIVGNSLIEVFEPVKRKGEEYTGKFYEYLLHMHNIDRMAQDKPVFGKSVTAEDSKRIADQLLKENPEFERLANRVYVYNRNLMQWRVDSGLVSQEQADEMNRIYPHYVPTFRDMSGIAGAKVIGNSVNISQTLKKATGSDRDILPIDLSMARQTMQTVQAAKRNLLGNRLLNDALANKDQVGKYITTIEKSDDSLDIDEQSDAALSSEKNNNIFKIYRDGKSVNMYVNNGIFEGLKAISSQTDNTDTSKLLSALSKPNTMFKQLVTGFNPMFMLKNPIRDVQDATLYSKNLREFAKEYPQTFKEMVNNSKDWQLYKSLGGTGSTFFDYETGIESTLNKGKLTRVKEATLGRIEYLNMLTEQAPRFAEFKATLEKAGNRDYDTLLKAVYNAADVTVNFGRSGSITQILNKTAVPFLNPSIQGTSKTIRTIVTTKGGTEWAKLVTKFALFGILPSVLNELLYWDDEDYEKLNDRDKDVNFVLKYGDNQWIKIPKGRVISFLGNLSNRGIRVARGQEVNWGDFLATTLDQTAPISPFESNIVSPIKAVKDNKTWYGSDIVPQRLQQYEPRDQYDEKTDAFSKWLGGILNYSPKKINYLIDAYTGVIGDFALPITTPTAETNPFVKAFTIDGTFSNEIGNKFYETKDKYNKYKNDTPTATVVTRYLNKQNSMASDLYAEIRKVQSSDISDKEKKAKASELRELINLIQANAVLYAEEYEQVVNKYINKFPQNPDRSADYAYLMANYELFGPEYAVKTYNLSTYNKNKHKNMQTVFNQIKNNFNTTNPVSSEKTETLPTAKDIPTKR